MAKEALESQLVVLRENLESQGLKVESVEVNVSNFGFKNQEDSNNHNFDQKKGSAKRFRVDAGEQALDGDNVSQVTETERQDEKVLWIILHNKKEANTWQHHWMVL